MPKTKTKRKKKPAKKKSKKIAKPKAKKTEKPIGEVVHFYNNINVAVIKVKGQMSDGDEVKFKGATTDFKQKVSSMQIEHEKIAKAKRGAVIGMKVRGRVRVGDMIYPK